MSKVDRIIKEIANCDETAIMEYDFTECFGIMREMRGAMKTFVDRVEAGTIRSTRTYRQFKEILDAD